MVAARAQQSDDKENYEGEVLKDGAMEQNIREAMGESKGDSIPRSGIVKRRKQASLLVDKVGFDQ